MIFKAVSQYRRKGVGVIPTIIPSPSRVRRTAHESKIMKRSPMEFHVFQCQADRDYFVVTDDTHLDDTLNNPSVSPTPGDKLEKIGKFNEMGKDRVAFDEGIAIRSIESQGFYRFHSISLDPMGEMPLAMPM